MIVFALFMFAGGLAIGASAQRRGGQVVVVRQVRRPMIHRRYIYRDPFWRTRYAWSPYWGYWGNYYYDSFWQSPYDYYLEQRYYLERELAGNRRELQKHQQEYRADGIITEKERRELDDDYKDVQRSTQRLRQFLREIP
jgi:hypothetical protein